MLRGMWLMLVGNGKGEGMKEELKIFVTCGNCVFCKQVNIDPLYACSKGGFRGTLYPNTNAPCKYWRPSIKGMEIWVQRANNEESVCQGQAPRDDMEYIIGITKGEDK